MLCSYRMCSAHEACRRWHSLHCPCLGIAHRRLTSVELSRMPVLAFDAQHQNRSCLCMLGMAVAWCRTVQIATAAGCMQVTLAQAAHLAILHNILDVDQANSVKSTCQPWRPFPDGVQAALCDGLWRNAASRITCTLSCSQGISCINCSESAWPSFEDLPASKHAARCLALNGRQRQECSPAGSSLSQTYGIDCFCSPCTA